MNMASMRQDHVEMYYVTRDGLWDNTERLVDFCVNKPFLSVWMMIQESCCSGSLCQAFLWGKHEDPDIKSCLK